MDKIRIIGYCGSGKTYISKILSEQLNIPMYELDNFVWERRDSGDRHNPERVRDAMLQETVNRDSWIIEGVHYAWTESTFERADVIFIINSNKWLSDWRMVKRFVKSKTRIEEANYEQSFRNLFRAFGWVHNYDMNDVYEATQPYLHKRITVRRSEDILDYIKVYKGIPAPVRQT